MKIFAKQFDEAFEITTVIFRVFKKEGDVIALFPYEIADSKGNCSSYQKIGQHGAADFEHCLKITRPARASEYESLLKELRAIGYTLRIKKRRDLNRFLKDEVSND